MYLLPTCRTLLFLERPLPSMWALRAVKFLMLIDALPGELFLAVGAVPARLALGLRGALSTVFALVRIVAM